MNKVGIGWRGWALAGVGALVLLVGIGSLFRLPAVAPSPRPRPSPASRPDTGLVRLRDKQNDLLKDDASLRDPTPLFLPTRWNATDDALPAEAQRSPGLSFSGYPRKLVFPEAELRLQLPAAVAMPQRPSDAFATDKIARPFGGFGETDEPVPALPARSAFVQIVAAGSGQMMLAQPLMDVRPPQDGPWLPLEFLVAVDPSGVVRPPVLTASSRVAGVDGYFQQYLVAQLHIGSLLPPGFYRVSFGP